MAINTAAKRRSVGGIPFLPLGPGVTPSAGKGAAWRQQSAWSYSGIAAAAPSSITVRGTLISTRIGIAIS